MPDRVAVYTSIAGGYDELPPHVDIPGVDFVAFSDRPLSRDDWQVVVDRSHEDGDPRRRAKYHKVLLPALIDTADYEFLPRYDFTIWVDGNHEVHNPAFVDDVLGQLDGHEVGLFAHPSRDCIYVEAVVSMRMEKYKGEPLWEQVSHYRHELGWPEHAGLYAGGTIARRHTAAAASAMQCWWAEISRWSVQDQLSLPLVLSAGRVDTVTFDHGQYQDRWTRRHPHADGTIG